jgi:SAM-dependent methyltransferase
MRRQYMKYGHDEYPDNKGMPAKTPPILKDNRDNKGIGHTYSNPEIHRTMKDGQEYVRCNLCDADNFQVLFHGRDRLYKKEGVFPVVKCNECGLIYLNPRPGQEDIGYYYPHDYMAYEKIGHDDIGIMGKGQGRASDLKNWIKKTILEEYYEYDFQNSGREKILKNLLKKVSVYPFLSKYRSMYYRTIPFSDKGKVLDIGCGNGSYLAWLKSLGWAVYGVEPDEMSVKFAAQEYGIDIFCGDLSDAHFPDSLFDCITMWHSLEHSHRPLETLKEIYRILKPEGLAVISVPNIHSLEAKLLKGNSFLYDVPRHLYDFSPRVLGEMLNKGGFRIQKISYSPRIDLFQWSLNSLLEEKKHKLRIESKWRTNVLVRLIARLLALCHVSSVMTFYAKKNETV